MFHIRALIIIYIYIYAHTYITNGFTLVKYILLHIANHQHISVVLTTVISMS
jgi:hypothetical protein